MSVVEYVLSLVATLDPDLLLDVESKFGADWQKQVECCKCGGIEDKYTVKQLRKLATKHKVKGRSKLRTKKMLVDALLKAEVNL